MSKSTSGPRRGRPPKQSREAEDTRALLIRSGVELLTEQGFVASGLDQILKKVGVPKGSFYHYFDSKEAFGLVVLNEYDTYFARKLDSHLLNTKLAPLDRLTHFVEDAKRGMARHQYKRGCLVGNLGQEISHLPDSFRPRIFAVFDNWQRKLARCLEEAKLQGALNDTTDCDVLAEVFWVGWEGAVSRAKLVQNTQPLDLFFEHFRHSIKK